MKKVFFTLIMIALLSSCSSIDPEVDFKGKIDEEFLTTISRGGVSMTLSPDYNKCYVFTMSCKDGIPKGKWKEEDMNKYDGFVMSMPSVHLFDGSSWTGYSRSVFDTDYYVDEVAVDNSWSEYCKLTGYNKPQLRKCQFNYDSKNNRLWIDDKWYNIESASKEKVVISYDDGFYISSGKDDHQLVMSDAAKNIYTYVVEPLFCDPENVDTYESSLDAMLAHIRVMRKYMGDIWHNRYGREIKLAKIEEVIKDGKLRFKDLTDEERDEIFGPSM